MNRILYISISVIILVFTAYSSKGETGKKILKIGVYNNPPKISVSEQGTVYGFHIDIIEEILKSIDYIPVYVPGTWEECLSRLNNGEIDILPDTAWSQERAKVYDFNSESVLLNWAVVYISKTAAIDAITDLDGKKIAVMRNSIHTDGESGIIRQTINFGIKCDFISVPTYEEAMNKVHSGIADAAVVNRLSGLLNEDRFNIKRTSVIFNPSQIKYAFCRKKHNKTLIELFDSRLFALKSYKESVYYKAFNKYLNPPVKKEEKFSDWAINIAFVIIILFVIIAIYLISGKSGRNESILLKKFFRENRSMRDIRAGITDHSLTAFALFSLPLFLTILYHGLSIGWDNIIWYYIPVTVVPVITALFKKHLSVSFKIISLIVCMSVTGILVLKSWGRVGTGFSFFLTAGTILTLIYGKRSGLTIITSGLVITVIYGILTQYKIFTYNYNMVSYSQSPSSWVFAIIVLFTMFYTIINGIERFYESLVSAVDNLEHTVEERTGDLDQVNKSLHKEIEIRRNVEEELIAARTDAEQANSAKGIFLANMSHEIRTPLNAILGYSQILLREKELPDVSRKQIEIINSSGEHLLDLINEILDMSKIEAGKIVLNYETFSLNSVLKQAENLFKEKTDRKGINFSVSASGEVPEMIYSDKPKLKQILINLLGNAVKFTDRGSVKLEVSLTSVDPRMLVFSITDTGKGITAGSMKKIFSPFEQADENKDRGGTGLGLSISRKYANLLGGDINAESRTGEGSCFTLTLPYIEGDAISTSDKAPENKVTGILGSSIPRILVIDDQETNRDILVQMLKPLGFIINEASGGIEAMELISGWKPDLLLLDLIMPDLSGVEVIKKIKSDPRCNDLKIMVITASVLEAAKQEIFRLGADAFIRKPFKEATILNEIARICNISYSYDEQKTDNKTDQVFASDNELAVMFRSVSSEIREAFTNALITGDIREIQNLTDRISSFNPGLAQQIMLRTGDFDFNFLITVLKNISKQIRNPDDHESGLIIKHDD